MIFKKNLARWSVGTVVALLLAFLTYTHYPFDHAEQNHLEERITQLNKVNQALAEENQHLRYIYDLSVEFFMNPTIVTLVDHYSREYLRRGGEEWRLLKTPEFTTYIMLSVIYAESKGNPTAVGDGGRARGLTQIWVSTARQYGETTAKALLDPETNISFAFKHFHHLLKKYNGNLALALYAWNRGPSKVDKLLSYGESPQNGYARKVYSAALLNNRQAIVGN